MPQVDEPSRRLPGDDLAPIPLLAIGCALEDAPTDATLQHDLQVGSTGVGVVGRPPSTDRLGPGVEGVVLRGVDIERQAQRLDHRFGVRFGGAVFSATIR